MSSALPARPIVFPSRTYNPPQQLQQPHQLQQHQPPPSSSLPGPSNLSFPAPSSTPAAYIVNNAAAPPAPGAGASVDGKAVAATPAAAPATPQPLTLEQQHITAVDGIVPTLQ